MAAVLQSRFVRLVLAVWAAIGAWDLLGAQLVPPSWRQNWPTIYDAVVMTSGYFPWWVWLVVGALIMTAFSLEYAGHQKRRADASGASSVGNTFYSPTATQIPPTPEQVRAIPSAPLRKMRKEGVALRNEHLSNDDEFALWLGRYGLWREGTLDAAATLSPVLHDRLETLNEIHGGIPGGVQVFSPEHGHCLSIVSEILRRVDKYLEEHQQ